MRPTAAGVNLLKLLDADLGVNGRGLELLVPEQPLDEPDVGSVFQHAHGAGVPQDVDATFAFHTAISWPAAVSFVVVIADRLRRL